jgi:hypothetical protein
MQPMHHASTPFWSVRHARWLKPLVALLVPIGGLFAALSLFHSVNAPTQSAVPASTVFLTAALFTVYFAYLFLLATIEVLGQPVERYAGRGFLVFGLTLVAYFFMAAKLIDERYKAITWMVLATSYFVGALHHYNEHATVADRGEKFRQALWTSIDVSVCSFLAFATWRYVAAHDPRFVEPVLAGLTIKDMAIALSLVLYLGFRGIPDYVLASRTANDYRDLLSASRATRMSFGPLMTSQRDVIAARKEITVLDFASSNSVRSFDLLTGQQFLNLDRAKINWRAFDIEPAFREDIEALPGVKSKAFSAALDEAVEWAKACDVLVVSHSLYLIPQLDGATALAKALPAGARVIVRGLGPSSVFCAPFEIWGADIWRPGVSHLWNTVFLDQLRKQAGLAPPGEGSGTKRERWNLDALAAGVDHAYVADFRSRQGFVGALGRMYGPRMSETFESEFLQLQAANRVLGSAELLPSSDLVYMFEKS